MTLENIKSLLDTTVLPVTYRAWPENAAPPLPFICYLYKGSNNFVADGRVYFPVSQLHVELYSKLKDPASEALVEAALDGIVWVKSEVYIESEKCYKITYEIEV